MLLQISFFVFLVTLDQISGHGMMRQPAGRSTLWRYNSAAAVNYDDNALYCGGAFVQWGTYGGKCGVCGDPYGAAHPQPNENTGKYGRGILAGQYTAGSVIDVEIYLSTNHLGHFNFSLCVLDNPNAPESGEGCFQGLLLANGAAQHKVVAGEKTVNTRVKLPDGLTCDRCVLRWHYQAGNNWGLCDDGTYDQGCGPQETFRNCADISIS